MLPNPAIHRTDDILAQRAAMLAQMPLDAQQQQITFNATERLSAFSDVHGQGVHAEFFIANVIVAGGVTTRPSSQQLSEIEEVQGDEEADVGAEISVPKIHVMIRIAGDDNTVSINVATKLHQERFPDDYERFRRGDNAPADGGTELHVIPGITNFEIGHLVARQIYSVEDLVAMDERDVGRIGQGFAALHQRVVRWKAGYDDTAVTRELAEKDEQRKREMEDLRRELQKTQAMIAEKTQENDTLRSVAMSAGAGQINPQIASQPTAGPTMMPMDPDVVPYSDVPEREIDSEHADPDLAAMGYDETVTEEEGDGTFDGTEVDPIEPDPGAMFTPPNVTA